MCSQAFSPSSEEQPDALAHPSAVVTLGGEILLGISLNWFRVQPALALA
jgi:hypothetical protein